MGAVVGSDQIYTLGAVLSIWSSILSDSIPRFGGAGLAAGEGEFVQGRDKRVL